MESKSEDLLIVRCQKNMTVTEMDAMQNGCVK